MTPKYRNRRLLIIGCCAVAMAAGVWLLSSALKQFTEIFYDPSEISAPDFVSESDKIRVGGLVVIGSVDHGEDLLTTFDLKDFEGESEAKITVQYKGVLPDLFREGQGIVVTGRDAGGGIVIAEEVLAKHDENYRPAS
ncbi:MAG: cytochrome c maturation protein CcmE [Maricaulaceae bacterium]